jgi:hypothetical protein
MTPELLEVIVDEEVVNERSEYEAAHDILTRLIEDRPSVDVLEVYFLNNWFNKTGNYSEDVAVVIESWLQENDFSISDEHAYYRSIMESLPTA